MDYSEYTFENSSVNNDSQTVVNDDDTRSEALSGYQTDESLVTEYASAFEEDDDEADLIQEECWEVELYDNNCDSFDDFIDRGLDEVINETPMQAIRYSAFEYGQGNNGLFSTQYRFEFDKPSFTKPQFSEHEASIKEYFMGYLAHRLLVSTLDRRELDDRDHFGKKRLDMAVLNDMAAYFRKCISSECEFKLPFALRSHIIINGFRYSIGTGNWGDANRAMQANSLMCQLYHIFEDVMLQSDAQLHNTHWGYIRPAETPEGQACGLMKSLALMSYVSINSLPADIGIVNNILVNEVRFYKNQEECVVPLFVVDLHLVWTSDTLSKLKLEIAQEANQSLWEALVLERYIEYIDAEEGESTMICISPDELYESSLYNLRKLGKSPRNTYQSAMKASVTTKVMEYFQCYRSYYVLWRKLYLSTLLDQEKGGTLGLERGNCEKLVDEGFVPFGIRVCGNDTLIGNVSTLSPEDELLGQRNVYRDVSTSLRSTEHGIVDQINSQVVMVIKEPLESIIVKRRCRHLIECLMRKLSVFSGSDGDTTAFSEVTVESISRKLGSFGFHRRGLEIMYNDKIHSRGRGPVNILTRQPVEGRSREGGLRFGEMERDFMITHGTALFLEERLNDVADAYRIHVRDICGLMCM
ncbi:3300_t:CDS:10 [Funneliformis caledonium]|uniref:DNA-directed RNA polymerase n=1 Tax=Funneliformis caledonium TaxID=1117310 RepID=A0A9N8VC59_9GLOM|nr:3300_t:CDS:10 [Funneliformis caledonium]